MTATIPPRTGAAGLRARARAHRPHPISAHGWSTCSLEVACRLEVPGSNNLGFEQRSAQMSGLTFQRTRLLCFRRRQGRLAVRSAFVELLLPR